MASVHTCAVVDISAKAIVNGERGVNQAYSRLSTTHGHITDCKLDSVVYAGVFCEYGMLVYEVMHKMRSTQDAR